MENEFASLKKKKKKMKIDIFTYALHTKLRFTQILLTQILNINPKQIEIWNYSSPPGSIFSKIYVPFQNKGGKETIEYFKINT